MNARRTSRTNFKEIAALQIDGRERKQWGKNYHIPSTSGLVN